MSQTKAQLVSGTTAQDLTVDNINTTSVNSGQLSNRNIIKNGAMMVDQRNSGSTASSSPSGSAIYGCDRMQFQNNGTGQLAYNVQQVADAPAGFYYSQKVTITTPESTGATAGADDRAGMQYRLEGYDINHLNLGTANAKDFIISFYIKVSTAGNYGLAIVNQTGTRSYCVLFAATTSWTRVNIKVPKDTSGTYVATNAQALALKFGFYNGSSRAGADQGITGTGSWQASNAPQGTTGQTQLGGIDSATWQITGLQLEVDSGSGVATDFEHRSFGQELELCRRYFQVLVDDGAGKSFGNGTCYTATNMHLILQLCPHMRAKPTIDQTTGSNYYRMFRSGGENTFNQFSLEASPSSERIVDLFATSATGVQGASALLRTDVSDAKIRFSAEL